MSSRLSFFEKGTCMKITDYPSVNELRDTDLLFIDGERGPKKIRYKEFKDNIIMPFELGIDANGNYGYKKVGADTVTPFKSVSGTFNTDTPGVYNVYQYEKARISTRNPNIITTFGSDLNIDPVSFINTDANAVGGIPGETQYCFLTKQRYDLLILHIDDDVAFATGSDYHFYDSQPIKLYGSIFENNTYKGPNANVNAGTNLTYNDFTTKNGYGHIKTKIIKDVPGNTSILYMSNETAAHSKSALALSIGVVFA